MPAMRPETDVVAVAELKAAGFTDREVSELSGVPVATIRLWRRRHRVATDGRRQRQSSSCEGKHDFGSLPAVTYAYLLGVYLGDGHVRAYGSSWFLRVALDCAYPGIIASCCEAIETLAGGRKPSIRRDRYKECVRIDSCWRCWPCLLPQHGPGRKHQRTIELVHWHQALIDQAPGSLLRGLIHTDGWRGVNRVVSKGKRYEYPRYQFSNRSDDIRRIFTDTCDSLGVEWRRWTRFHISVAKRESVALLDQFVGPKA